VIHWEWLVTQLRGGDVRTRARVSTNRVLERIGELGLIPVVEIADASRAVPLTAALTQADLPCVEITFRTEAAAEAISTIRAAYPDLLLGAGTVLSPAQVDTALEAGASFLVTPGFSPEVVDHALAQGATILPGVCTPSEIEAAMARGLDVLKFFPAEMAGGAEFIKAVAAPYPAVRFVPTGGITAANAIRYLELKSVHAVAGSWMVKRDLILAADFATIGRLASEAVSLVRSARTGVRA
jgi:2-dehydro-3-deoxyphosphogluconate aldolase/(4S)-4-hydroxy-2-oxoglutarate aldolase